MPHGTTPRPTIALRFLGNESSGGSWSIPPSCSSGPRSLELFPSTGCRRRLFLLERLRLCRIVTEPISACPLVLLIPLILLLVTITIFCPLKLAPRLEEATEGRYPRNMCCLCIYRGIRLSAVCLGFSSAMLGGPDMYPR